jgi:hypothetical protein
MNWMGVGHMFIHLAELPVRLFLAIADRQDGPLSL